jgi:hypothetical protein
MSHMLQGIEMNKEDDMINFVIKKLDSEVKTLEMEQWADKETMEDMKNAIRDKEEAREFRYKEMAVLKNAIQILEDLK